MTAADTKPKAGDLVLLRQSQQGSKAGLHWVVELVEGGMVVETLTSNWAQRFTAPFEDVVRCYRGLGDAEVTLAPRLAPKVEAAAPHPEPSPRLVKVHVINASKDGYEITRPRTLLGGQVSARYRATRVVLVDASRQSHSEFLVDSRDVEKFLIGVQGSYLSDKGLPVRNPHAPDPQFSEDS
jgi:hypothetical protein